MKIARYSQIVIQNEINRAVERVRDREQKYADDYIRLNPSDEGRRQNDAWNFMLGAEMARQEIMRGLEPLFNALAEINKEGV